MGNKSISAGGRFWHKAIVPSGPTVGRREGRRYRLPAACSDDGAGGAASASSDATPRGKVPGSAAPPIPADWIPDRFSEAQRERHAPDTTPGRTV